MRGLDSSITFAMVSQLLARLGQAGLTAQQIRRLIQDEAAAQQWVEAFPRDLPLLRMVKSPIITIDYSLSLEQMIDAGKYHRVSEGISNHTFPRRESDRRVDRIELELLQVTDLERRLQTSDILAQMDRLSLRPAVIEEVLALGAYRAETAWITSKVVAFGSTCGTDVLVPVISFNAGQQELSLQAKEPIEGWDMTTFFVVVRK